MAYTCDCQRCLAENEFEVLCEAFSLLNPSDPNTNTTASALQKAFQELQRIDKCLATQNFENLVQANCLIEPGDKNADYLAASLQAAAKELQTLDMLN